MKAKIQPKDTQRCRHGQAGITRSLLDGKASQSGKLLFGERNCPKETKLSNRSHLNFSCSFFFNKKQKNPNLAILHFAPCFALSHPRKSNQAGLGISKSIQAAGSSTQSAGLDRQDQTLHIKAVSTKKGLWCHRIITPAPARAGPAAWQVLARPGTQKGGGLIFSPCHCLSFL